MQRRIFLVGGLFAVSLSLSAQSLAQPSPGVEQAASGQSVAEERMTEQQMTEQQVRNEQQQRHQEPAQEGAMERERVRENGPEQGAAAANEGRKHAEHRQGLSSPGQGTPAGSKNKPQKAGR